LNELISWPKFDEGCWTYNMIPVHTRAVLILPPGPEKNGKIVLDLFAILTIILQLIWPFFLSWVSRHNITCMWI